MTSTRQLGERNQVPHFWLGYDVALHALLCLAVGAREPFVLTEMLRPRRNDKVST